MSGAKGQRWICSNAKCRHEIILFRSAETEHPAVQCGCGSTMKKVYARPQLRNIRDQIELNECIEVFSLVRNHP